MENTDFATEEEVLMEEATEEAVNASSGTGFIVVVGLGIASALAALGYKYIAKPLIAKRKAAKEETLYSEKVEDKDIEVVDSEDEVD